MRSALIILALLTGFALAAAVAWNAAEAHYQNCVRAAQTLPDGGYLDVMEETRTGEDPHRKAIYKRVQGCSRLP